MFKFAHIADSHIGGWRDLRMRNTGIEAFNKAIDFCIKEKVDFVVFSGDLFDTAIPNIEAMNNVTSKLSTLKKAGIRFYAVPGSHDFSPSGKTFLTTLEAAGLLKNVAKASLENNSLKLEFTIDEKTSVKIAGMPGRKGALERTFFEDVDVSNLEQEGGFKIFVFHSAISEFKPKNLESMESIPLSLLPKGFNYYAAGHVHARNVFEEKDYGFIVYPGPTFPNNFSELEKLKHGGFYVVTVDNNNIIKMDFQPIIIRNVYSIILDCDGKSTSEVESELMSQINNREFYNTIVLLRLYGKLSSGKPSDINLKEFITTLYNKGAFFVMKNTSQLVSKEFEEVKVNFSSPDEIEDKTLRENVKGKIEGTDYDALELSKELIALLSEEKNDSELKRNFENRIVSNFRKQILEKFSKKTTK